MTQTQHTWKALKSRTGFDIVNGERHVAGHLYGNAGETPSETADMNLIAAAPDMLAALEDCDKAFVSWQIGQIPGRPEDILTLINQVRRAIKKAKGEK